MAATVPILTLILIFGKDISAAVERREESDVPPALTPRQARTVPMMILAVFALIHYLLILEVARHVDQTVMRVVYGALLALPVYTMCAVTVLLYYLVLRFKNRKRL